jgi:hypothetical protein
MSSKHSAKHDEIGPGPNGLGNISGASASPILQRSDISFSFLLF